MAGLGAYDGDLVPVPCDQIGLAGQHGAAAPEVEAVLLCGEDSVALLLSLPALLVQQGDAVHHPAGLVGV